MSNKQFEWTDTLVKEFHQWYEANKGKFEDHLREFKFQKMNGEKSDPPISPSPLFRTEDGVDIYEETNNVYGVNTQTWEKRTLSLIVVPNLNGYKWFAVEYNRDRYILLNKPTLSLNEVLGILQSEAWHSTDFVEKINQLAKAKL
jgi:hypothetical protein